MRSVGLFEAKTRLSALCAEVAEGGDPLIVTRRGVPWVRIEPIRAQRLTISERRAAYMARHAGEEGVDVQDFVPPPRCGELPAEEHLE
jgi:prevent-host-death family protein